MQTASQPRINKCRSASLSTKNQKKPKQNKTKRERERERERERRWGREGSTHTHTHTHTHTQVRALSSKQTWASSQRLVLRTGLICLLLCRSESITFLIFSPNIGLILEIEVLKTRHVREHNNYNLFCEERSGSQTEISKRNRSVGHCWLIS